MKCCSLWALVLLGACRLGFDPIESSAQPDAPPGTQSFVVGGTVTGLMSSGLVLALNGGEQVSVASDGTFQFMTPILDGSPYAVTIASAPTTQGCLVANGEGMVAGMPVGDIDVTCYMAGACPTNAITYTNDGSFALPEGCSALIVDAYGGGGAGTAKHMGNVGAAGGAGGHARRTFTAQAPGTMYTVVIGKGGTCASRTATAGGYTGGGGGNSGGSGNGANGTGAGNGGTGGLGPTGVQPGGNGGNGGYGGGGGGGGGDQVIGSSGGGASVVRMGATDLVVAGGGGAGGASDQNGDQGGDGGAACTGAGGANGQNYVAGTRSGGGGGGGGCVCLGGTCDASPSSNGGAGGTAGTQFACTATENGTAGRVVITFQ